MVYTKTINRQVDRENPYKSTVVEMNGGKNWVSEVLS